MGGLAGGQVDDRARLVKKVLQMKADGFDGGLMFRDDRCYRPDEVAEKLNIDKSTVYRMINDVEDPLPAYRLGTHLRIHGKELNAYLERRKVNTAEGRRE
jgi:excisionase family DNA binding protein